MTYKHILPLFIVLAVVSCSHKERKGLSLDQRNYNETDIENFIDEFRQPSDAIYVFETNIQYVITQELISLCDSIFGKGFVSKDQIKEIKSTLKEDLHKFQLPNPTKKIDSKNIESNVALNEDGYYSLKFNLDDLSTYSPLVLKLNNLLTQECMARDLEINTNGYSITFTIDAMCNEVKRDGIYTVSDESGKMDSPYHKYDGNCLIGISLKATGADNKTEYYFKKVSRQCSHYTQSQYSTSEVTYL